MKFAPSSHFEVGICILRRRCSNTPWSREVGLRQAIVIHAIDGHKMATAIRRPRSDALWCMAGRSRIANPENGEAQDRKSDPMR